MSLLGPSLTSRSFIKRYNPTWSKLNKWVIHLTLCPYLAKLKNWVIHFTLCPYLAKLNNWVIHFTLCPYLDQA